MAENEILSPEAEKIVATGKKWQARLLLAHPLICAFVFFVPKDILDRSEICADYVRFMKRIFPNIEALEAVSAIPQVTAFYVSVLWIWLGILSFFIYKLMFARKFTTAQWKERIKGDNVVWVILGLFVFAFMAINIYYTAWVVQEPIGVHDYSIFLGSKFSNYFWITLFSIFIPVGVFFFCGGLIFTIVSILNFKNKE